MQPLDSQPALIQRAYERLVEAIADGTLAPGQRIRQEELGRMLGVSRQPISHALQLLKQQRLVEENGRRGLIVSTIDAVAIRELYQVRTALDALAARLAAERIADRVIDTVAAAGGAAGTRGRPEAAPGCAGPGLHSGRRRVSHRALSPVRKPRDRGYGRGAVAALQTLDGRRARTIPSSARWCGQSMRKSCGSSLAGDAAGAESAARHHTDRAGAETARRLAQSASSREGDRDGTYGAAASAVR